MQNTLKQLRAELNMSQAELASKVGISRIHINRIERNKAFPSEAVFKRISRVLGICPYELINFCTGCSFQSCKKSNFFLPGK